ncbi:AfsA-related hotdog domain-containing protein [Gordonia polyisoprenivorans]|uniref:AfsA-related hotdog domain-containing protein n=1 Tax=Gordonia polyisoprenivorans TaxID=84595 RepID=UPI0011D280ED|nr:AfsA-related hotdog domain-containing protein [Gordonia polyisoprenivorans]
MTYTLQPQLSHSTLVPREHVHRDALSEVYPTDIICDRYPNFRIGVHLPKSHSYYSDHIGPAEFQYDPLLILECFRQTSILIAHRHVGAGFDQAFIFNDADIQVVSHEATTITTAPGNGELSAVIVEEKVRGEEVIGITLEMECLLGGTVAATVTMTIQWMPRDVWARVRGKGRARLGLDEYSAGITPQPGRGPRTVRGVHPAETLGRRIDRNSVLGDVTATRSGLDIDVLVDQHHPSLFDHPLDHIPGAVLFEAIRQAGILAAHETHGLSARRLVLESLRAEFTRFGELDLHTVIRVRPVDEPDPGYAFEVEILQEDESITSGRVRFSRNVSVETGSTTGGKR